MVSSFDYRPRVSATFVGRYEILEEIASGGMATVYAARVAGTAGFEKLVAIKQMLPGIRVEPQYRTMFIDEGRVAAHVRSPHVVATYDMDAAADGSLFIVMDLVIGTSMAGLMKAASRRKEPLPIAAVVELIAQAARGLHDAHEAVSSTGQPLRIVHRDVSPQNILVGADGIARITDFGVAHAAERMTKTVGMNIKGKLAYCSPEQARVEPLDGRSDVFSLGIVLWEALTGRRLFRRDNPGATLTAVVFDDIPDPRSVRPEIPPALSAVVAKVLSRDRDARYPTALAFADALSALALPTTDPHGADIRALVYRLEGAAVNSFIERLQAAIAKGSQSTVHMLSSFADQTELGSDPEHRTLAATLMEDASGQSGTAPHGARTVQSESFQDVPTASWGRTSVTPPPNSPGLPSSPAQSGQAAPTQPMPVMNPASATSAPHGASMPYGASASTEPTVIQPGLPASAPVSGPSGNAATSLTETKRDQGAGWRIGLTVLGILFVALIVGAAVWLSLSATPDDVAASDAASAGLPRAIPVPTPGGVTTPPTAGEGPKPPVTIPTSAQPAYGITPRATLLESEGRFGANLSAQVAALPVANLVAPCLGPQGRRINVGLSIVPTGEVVAAVPGAGATYPIDGQTQCVLDALRSARWQTGVTGRVTLGIDLPASVR